MNPSTEPTQAQGRSPKQRRFLVAGLAVSAVAILALVLPRAFGPAVAAVRVERKPLIQKVVATGRVAPPARVNLGASVIGTVVKVAADEGDEVAAGAVLIELDSREAQAAVAQAQAVVQAAAARVEQVRRISSRLSDEALRQSEIRLEQAKRELNRQRELLSGGSISQQALDEAERTFSLATSERDAALAQAAASSATGWELRAAIATQRQAEAALRGAEARLAQLRIVSPGNAAVLARSVEPGDLVQPGRVLMVLARAGVGLIEVEPDEKSLAWLARGQRARVSADAFPKESFAAEVASLAPSVDPERGTIKVKLRPIDPPSYLRSDMTVSVDIEVGRREAALVLPPEVLREDPANGPFVLGVERGRVVRRPVRVGLRGEGALEVLDGLSEGDVVLAPEATAVELGARVRPRTRK